MLRTSFNFHIWHRPPPPFNPTAPSTLTSSRATLLRPQTNKIRIRISTHQISYVCGGGKHVKKESDEEDKQYDEVWNDDGETVQRGSRDDRE
ncbi:hypothetical protein A2U01_0056326 [Trifolium medium]|uniref:Uncharacterized protein n=1 Tax=Trifolium medium TaxID=97028 RepID=A0A392RHP0_9FABA|nr:hypothetical protein [Trifolium medium]